MYTQPVIEVPVGEVYKSSPCWQVVALRFSIPLFRHFNRVPPFSTTLHLWQRPVASRVRFQSLARGHLSVQLSVYVNGS